MSRQKTSARLRFTGAGLLLCFLFFLVPAVRDGDSGLYLLAAAVPCVILLCFTLFARMFSLDRMILALALYICSAGIAAVAMTDPSAALTHSLHCCAGITALLIGGVLIRSLTPSLLTSSCTAFLGLLLLSGKLISPSFPGEVNQAALALLMIAFASLLSRQGPVSAILLGAAALALLLFRGCTADALLWGLIALLLLFAADGRLVIVLPSLAALVFGFAAYGLFSGKYVPGNPDSLSALLSAGAVGADTLPEDVLFSGGSSLFPRLAGHYGLIFAGLTVMLFLPLTLRGASVAAFARSRFHAVLAMAICLFLSLQALGGLLDIFSFLPFEGPDIPFLTSSLPDLCAHLFLAGMLCGISGRNDADLAEDAHLAMLAK